MTSNLRRSMAFIICMLCICKQNLSIDSFHKSFSDFVDLNITTIEAIIIVLVIAKLVTSNNPCVK